MEDTMAGMAFPIGPECIYRGKGSTSATLLMASALTLNTIRYKWATIRYTVENQ